MRALLISSSYRPAKGPGPWRRGEPCAAV